MKATASNSKLGEIHVVEEDLNEMRRNLTESDPNPRKKLTFSDEINKDEI